MVLQVLWSCWKPPCSFSLSSLQASRVSITAPNLWDRNSFLRQPSEKPECWTHAPTFSHSREKLGVRHFLLLILNWTRRGYYCEWVCASPESHLCTWNSFLSALRFRKIEVSLWGSPSKYVNIGCTDQCSFLLLRRSQGLGISSQPHCNVLVGGTVMSKCHEFSYQLLCAWFHTYLGRKCLNLLLHFSQRELVQVLFNWCLHGGRRIWGFLFY